MTTTLNNLNLNSIEQKELLGKLIDIKDSSVRLKILQTNQHLFDDEMVKEILFWVLCENFQQFDANNLLNLAMEIAQVLDSNKSQAGCQLARALVVRKNGNAVDFDQQYNSAKLMYQDYYGGCEDAVYFFGYLGGKYRTQQKYQDAVEVHTLGLDYSIESGDKELQMVLLTSLGIDYHELANFDRALECHRKSIDIAREIHNEDGELKALGNIAHVYRVLGKLDEAEQYLQHVLELSREMSDTVNEFITLRHLIDLYWSQEKHTVVVTYYRILNDLIEKMNVAGKDEDILLGMTAAFGTVVYNSMFLMSDSRWMEPTPVNLAQRFLFERIRASANMLADEAKLKEHAIYTELAEILNPNSEEILLARASQLLLLGEVDQLEEALMYCDRILAINPKNVAAWRTKGIILSNCKRYVQAISCFEEALKLGSEDAETWVEIGVCYMYLEKWEEMLRCDEKALELQPNYASAWEGKGVALMHLEQFKDAANFLEKSYNLEPIPKRESFPELVQQLRNANKPRRQPVRFLRWILKPIVIVFIKYQIEMGRQASAKGRYEEAVTQTNLALQLCEAYSNQEMTITALTQLGAYHIHLGNFQESLEHSNRAFKITKEINELSNQGIIQGNLGLAHLGLEQIVEAGYYLQRALNIARQTDNNVLQQKWIAALAQIQINKGEDNDAIELINEALNLTGENDKWDSVNLLLQRATLLKKNGRVNEAIEIGHQCLSIVQESTDPYKRIFILKTMGDLYFPIVEKEPLPVPWTYGIIEEKSPTEVYVKANSFYKQALRDAEVIGNLNIQGNILWKMAMPITDDTIDYVEKGLPIARSLNDKSLEFAFLMVGGLYYCDKLFPQEAELYFRKAQSIALDEPEYQVPILTYLGGTSLCLGNFVEAREYTESALKLAREAGSTYFEVQCLGQLYNIHLNLGEGIAFDYYGQILGISNTIARSKPLSIGGTLNFGVHIELRILPRARALMMSERYEQAFSLFQEAVEFLENVRHNLPIVKQREGLIWDKKDVYRETLITAFKAGLYQDAFKVLELTKTRNLSDIVASRDPVAGNIPPETLADYLTISKREKELRQRYWELSAQSLTDNDSDAFEQNANNHKQIWRKAQGELLAVLERIRAHDPTAFLPPDIGTPIEFSQVLKLSQKFNAAIVELIVTKENIGVLIIEPTTSEIRAMEVEWGDTELQQLSLSSEQEIDETTEQLWNNLVYPIVELLATIDTKKVIIVPSRTLNLLPLHAAWSERNGQRAYFTDYYEISYAPSATILNQCVIRYQTKQYNSGLLTVTNPLQDTPFASEEIALIGELFDDKSLIAVTSQEDARLFTRMMSEAGYLHICSHGDEKGLHLISSTDQPRQEMELQQGEDQASDDIPSQYPTGLLTAQEIEQMDLAKVKLAMLSACESGKTKPGGFFGDEYVGLPASFIIAGVPTVVASLWKVSGISTVLLMWKFYSLLLDELAASQALREAQLWLRDITKSETLEILEEFWLEHHQQSLELDEGSVEYERVRRAFWMAESGMRWVKQQSDLPFAKPYWWAGFQLIGWPGKV